MFSSFIKIQMDELLVCIGVFGDIDVQRYLTDWQHTISDYKMVDADNIIHQSLTDLLTFAQNAAGWIANMHQSSETMLSAKVRLSIRIYVANK